jgi:hypothetical protein
VYVSYSVVQTPALAIRAGAEEKAEARKDTVANFLSVGTSCFSFCTVEEKSAWALYVSLFSVNETLMAEPFNSDITGLGHCRAVVGWTA